MPDLHGGVFLGSTAVSLVGGIWQAQLPGKFYFELGRQAQSIPPRLNDYVNDDDELGFTASGALEPGLFPPGIPLPPVQQLPAEFECPFCFKVKKFWKPSDWTRHVHEDLRPFSCTFSNCPETKSFKRKRDWIRHENERHRHLEWWQCSFQECNHICYRKDNFVQHLVREHKMAEPRIKRGTTQNNDEGVWLIVDQCHCKTNKKPQDEPCRFCGQVCSTFEKLSVHVSKHMEQIAMPVLELVSMTQFSVGTTVTEREDNYGPQRSDTIDFNLIDLDLPGSMTGFSKHRKPESPWD